MNSCDEILELASRGVRRGKLSILRTGTSELLSAREFEYAVLEQLPFTIYNHNTGELFLFNTNPSVKWMGWS